MAKSKKKKQDSSSSSEEEASTSKTPVKAAASALTSNEDKFICPDKFRKSKPDYDGLCLEDVQGSSQKEMWLIRAPLDFDSSVLDGEELIRNAQYKLGEGSQFEAIVKESKQVGNITAVLPSKKHKKLLPGPAFQGLISVVSSVNVAPVDLPMSPPKMSFDIPSGLRQRFTPFGCGSPSKKRKKRDKGRKRDNPFEDSVIKIEEEVDGAGKSPSKKKKKKRGKKDEIKLPSIKIEEEQDDEQNNNQQIKLNIKQEIYSEGDTQVVDDLNLTQTKKKKKKKHKKD